MSTTRPFILITNDDGIRSDGIVHLWDATARFADIAIVAPHSEKSGCGVSVTSRRPLTIHEYPWVDATPAWSVDDGTPADCVKMAIRTLLPRAPDLIVSGVNRGANSGRTVLYSGTVGGVIEGVLRNIPGIAFSFVDELSHPVGSVRGYLTQIIQYFLKHPLPEASFMNVNFPALYEDRIKGIRMARQGRSYWIENPERRIHPEGKAYYWLGGKWASTEEAPDSDVALLDQGFVTIAPIYVGDLTDVRFMNAHQDEIQKINITNN